MLDPPAKKIRVALYIRVSTEEQKRGFGLDMQKQALLEHVERNNHRGWYTEPRWLFSEQSSGADRERGELKRLLNMASKKEFDLLLVWKIDRISRDLSHLLAIFEILRLHDVDFASLKENVDFTGPIGKLVFHMFGALAEFEREMIKMRTEEGKRTSAYQGNYVGGGVPYGYKRTPNRGSKGSKLELIPVEGDVVRGVFNSFVIGEKTTTEIANDLNSRGIPKGTSARLMARGKPWTEDTIRDILKNEIYTGLCVANRWEQVSKKPKKYKERPRKEWITSQVPVCVDILLFQQAQERLSNVQRGGGGRELYMLAGKLTDVATGKGFIGYLSGKGTKNYRRKKFVAPDGTEWKTLSLAAERLEDYVWEYIRLAMDKPEAFLARYEEQKPRQQERLALEAERLARTKTVSAFNEMIDSVDADFYRGGTTQEQRDKFKTEYTAKRDEAFAHLAGIEKRLRELLEYEGACEDLRKFSTRLQRGLDTFNYRDKCDLVHLLVEKVEIFNEESRKAKVFFRFDQKAVRNHSSIGRTNLPPAEANIVDLYPSRDSDGGR